MGTLSENWLTENHIDFEYKKYVLLGYLQMVKEHFNDQKLYPDFAELINHYKNLISIKNNTSCIENGFKKKLKGIDFNNLTFVYENVVNDDSLNELKQIIAYTEPLLIKELQNGKSIFDFAEKHISTDHIGILPIYKKEGYFVLCPFHSKDVYVYNYNLSKLNLMNQEVFGLNTSYFNSYHITLTDTVDKIKFNIIETNPEMPNPAVYIFKANADIPNEETFLPIAKRLLYKTLVA